MIGDWTWAPTYENWFFFVGLCIGGLAVWLFYSGRLRELDEELDEAKRSN